MTTTDAAILGAVQGFTEFLPVSSSGHLVLTQHLLRLGGAENLTFDILLHVATLFAVVVYFWRDIARLAVGTFTGDRDARRTVFLLFLAMIPTGIIGLGIKKTIESAFDSPLFVGVNLLVTGGILFLIPRLSHPKYDLRELRGRHALIIGAAQGLAALPGISRSGTTICAGIASGIEPVSAARFSFLLAIPAILAALLLDIRNVAGLEGEAFAPIGIGMAVSFVIGLVAIHWLLRVARKGRFDVFAVYCWVIGIIVIIAAYNAG